MTAFAVAVERRQWSLVSLFLLLGVAEAAAKLPPESLTALIDLLGDAALTAAQGRAATALALAGGAAPAHELIRLVEEAKERAKAGR